MATLRIKRKLLALNKENCEGHPRSNFAQSSNVPRSQEDYITQVFEEFEDRVTTKLSQEISRTDSRTLGAISRLDDFLLNPLIQGHSGTTPETFRNAYGTNQGTNDNDSRVILILNRASLRARWHENLTRKLTWKLYNGIFLPKTRK